MGKDGGFNGKFLVVKLPEEEKLRREMRRLGIVEGKVIEICDREEYGLCEIFVLGQKYAARREIPEKTVLKKLPEKS